MGGMTHEAIVIDASFKGYPAARPPARTDDLAGLRWKLTGSELPLPLAVLRESALAHNLAWMQAFARRKGVELAPHGKTSMSPELLRRQLDAGAWGLTFASVFQARLGARVGAQRLIIANQVLADADLDGLVALHAAHPGLRIWFLVDSLAQIALIEDWARRRAFDGVLDVLLELGLDGQRAGCRTHEQALAVGRACVASRVLRLGGVECYEGLAATCDSAHDSQMVTGLMQRVMALARAGCDEAWFGTEGILLSAGGSAVFDLVVPLLRGEGLPLPVRGVLRSGCYLTHDHGSYARFLSRLQEREGLDASLRPALEVWALVQSVPEPGLALLGCGRRDLSHDSDLPVPLRHVACGASEVRDAPAGWTIRALNDQHAHLRFDPQGLQPAVGDRIALGISHPCTTFDKWRWLALVDDDWTVTGAVHTAF